MSERLTDTELARIENVAIDIGVGVWLIQTEQRLSSEVAAVLLLAMKAAAEIRELRAEIKRGGLRIQMRPDLVLRDDGEGELTK